jgi:hypothetical protein
MNSKKEKTMLQQSKKRNICVLLNGYPISGKDLFANYLFLEAEMKGWNTQLFSSADEAKKIAKTIFGWNGEKTDEWRIRLSKLVDYLDSKYDSSYVALKKIFLQYKQNNINNLIVVMFREPEKIEKLKSLCLDENIEFLTIFVSRKTAKKACIMKTDNCHSDMNVENYQYDICIENNSDIQNLKKEAVDLFQFIFDC